MGEEKLKLISQNFIYQWGSHKYMETKLQNFKLGCKLQGLQAQIYNVIIGFFTLQKLVQRLRWEYNKT